MISVVLGHVRKTVWRGKLNRCSKFLK